MLEQALLAIIAVCAIYIVSMLVLAAGIYLFII
jgi:hypothetical protein